MGRESLEGIWIADPIVGKHADGHLEVFGVGTDGRLYRKHQVGPNQSFVADWTPFSDQLRIALYGEQIVLDPLTTQPSFAVERPDRAFIFVRSVRGRITYAYAVPGGWSDWKSLSAVQDGHPAIGNPVAVQDPATGRVRVFARGRNGDLLEKNPTGSGPEDWGDGARWDSHGGILANDPHVLIAGSDQLAICVRGSDGDAWQFAQGISIYDNVSHSIAPRWLNLGCDSQPGAKVAGNPIQRATTLGIVWKGINGHLWNRFEAPGFGNFQLNCQDSGADIASDVAVLTLPGREYQFWQSGQGQLMLARFQSGRWEPVTSLADGVQGTPRAQSAQDGRVEVFFRGFDGALQHLWEETPGGAF